MVLARWGAFEVDDSILMTRRSPLSEAPPSVSADAQPQLAPTGAAGSPATDSRSEAERKDANRNDTEIEVAQFRLYLSVLGMLLLTLGAVVTGHSVIRWTTLVSVFYVVAAGWLYREVRREPGADAKRRAAAILFSMSESSDCNCWKLVLALRSG